MGVLSPEKLMSESLCVEIQVETPVERERDFSNNQRRVQLTLARDRRDPAQINSQCHGHKVCLVRRGVSVCTCGHCFSLKVYPCRFWWTLPNGFQFVSIVR